MNDKSKSIPKLQELAAQYAEALGTKRGHERAAMLADLDMASIERSLAAVYRNAVGAGRVPAGVPLVVGGVMLYQAGDEVTVRPVAVI